MCIYCSQIVQLQTKQLFFKYNEITEAWTTDLIEACGNVLRITDKNAYIEYICSKKICCCRCNKKNLQNHIRNTQKKE